MNGTLVKIELLRMAGWLVLAGMVQGVGMPALGDPLPQSRPERQGVSSARLERLHEVVGSFVEDGRHAGAVWLLARHGRVVDWGALGYRDLEKQLPMEKDTICRIYSMSKIVTSVAVLMLVEEGKIGVEDPVRLYLPEMANRKVWVGGSVAEPELVAEERPVTILHLLTHTSGLVYDFAGQEPIHELYRKADLWGSVSLKEFLRKVAELPLQHQPGERFTYGINTDVLGRLVEVVSGRSFEEFLRERIFEPLQMADTAFSVPLEKRERLAVIYQEGKTGGLVPVEPILGVTAEPGLGMCSGGAGLFSTVGDYARFAQMLLNGGEWDGERLLGRKTVEWMRQNFLASVPGGPTHGFSKAHGFGLGVEVRIDLVQGGGPGSVGQFGWYGAATTYCNVDPQEDTVALLFVQHFPFNPHGIFNRFSTAWYQSLVE